MEPQKRHFKLLHRLILSAVLSGLFLLFVGGVGYWEASRLMHQLDQVAAVQLPAIRNTTLLDMSHDAVRAAVLGSIVAAESGASEELLESARDLDEEKANFAQYLSAIDSLPLSQKTKAALDQSRPVIMQYLTAGQEIVALAAKRKVPEALLAIKPFHLIFDELETTLNQLGDLIEADSKSNQQAGQDVLQRIEWLTILSCVISSLVSVFIILSLVRTLKQLLHDISGSASALAEASGILTSNNVNLSDSVTRTASSLEETSAAVEELSSIMQRNNEHALEAQHLSEISSRAAQVGEEKIERMIQTIETVAQNSRQMQNITQTMDDIAFQTNLLALNAAIEAARAGNDGRGFAVVADAVRGLAAKSSQAAKDINIHIVQTVEVINKGNALAGESRSALQEIRSATQKLSVLNRQLAASHHEQLVGLTEISKAVNLVDQDSQRNAGVADNLTTTSTGLENNALELRLLVEDAQNQVGVVDGLLDQAA